MASMADGEQDHPLLLYKVEDCSLQLSESRQISTRLEATSLRTDSLSESAALEGF